MSSMPLRTGALVYYFEYDVYSRCDVYQIDGAFIFRGSVFTYKEFFDNARPGSEFPTDRHADIVIGSKGLRWPFGTTEMNSWIVIVPKEQVRLYKEWSD